MVFLSRGSSDALMPAIDISYWQGHPDFAQVKASGVGLVIMKCTDAESGRLTVDSMYAGNLAAARAQGIPTGAYFFNGPVDPATAADHLIATSQWRAGDILALDVENATGVARWTPAQSAAFCSRLIARGVPAQSILVYMSSSVTRAADWSACVRLGVGLWVAQYGSNNGQPQGSPATGTWGSWKLWQYSSAGSIPGISGRVDINQLAPGFTGGGIPITPNISAVKTRLEEEDEVTELLWYVPKDSTDGKIKKNTTYYQPHIGAPVCQLDLQGIPGVSSEYTAILRKRYRMNDGTAGTGDNPEALANFYTVINGDDLQKLIAERGLVSKYSV
jgi:GH25 family lysozyme M1 (1,4-beta-N-acetylmuramidase)